METANILLSIGGDDGNTVMKWGVTAAEIAVLRAIHGEAAVNDVEPTGETDRTHRQERERLIGIYGRARFADDKPVVDNLFPGVAARVFERLDELDLDESFFKPTSRAKPRAEPAEVVPDKAQGRRSKKAPQPAKAQPATQGESGGEADDGDDGIGDMDDGQGIMD
ncbi:hypothetical protein [Rhodopseudomonas pseudopalustris]|uniref:Uncharacterized protein n=1 Tax=Rhodopseudomonas pseudopalustris TaxID=1513892 RepID=A0A1H8WIM4_9BRAD|nr:hypothetical protein [Rhodopseudomonas pseudopalustris]SEP27459.1 hypothetical protein SAMN05444123_112126 [Rhodopseudomonas pseudopalustris]